MPTETQTIVELGRTIEAELAFFDSEEQRAAFRRIRCLPNRSEQTWSWIEPYEHTCYVVARDERTQIVWCPTGFGPEFPWSTQVVGEAEMGMDCDWHAYLYEAFVTSTMWPPGPPEGFACVTRGERGGNDRGDHS